MSEELVRLDFDTIKKLIKNKLMSAGLDEVQAESVADHLAYADAHGVHSHGAVRVEYYSERIAKGGTTANPNIQFKKTGTSVGMLDGDNALGHYVAMLGAEKAIELAQETGIGVVGMKRMGHAGTLSYYIRKATEQGLIMLSMCQSDPMVVLYGGTEPYFGTNPIGFGAPAKNSPPIVFDMATTVGAWGKILDARAKGNSIPDTWAVDDNGNPTTDPNKVAGLVPIAEAKGSGLMFMVDILAGILVGQPSGKHVSSMYSDLSAGRELGHLHIVLNPDYFTSKEYVMNAIENMISEIHAMKPAEGLSSVRYPGEGQFKRAVGYQKDGIPIVKDIYDYLLSDDVHYNRYEGMNAFAEED